MSSSASPPRSRAGLRRVAENVSWLLGERSLLLVLNFAVSVWFINYLGPDDYGRYAYAVSFAALFAALAGLGLDSIVVRELSRPGAETGRILGTAFALRAGASCLTYAAVAATIAVVGDDPVTRTLVRIVALALLADPAQVADLWFQSRIESKYVVWLRSAVAVAALAAKAGLIVLAAPLAAFAGLYAAQALVAGVGLLLVFARRRPTGLDLRSTAACAGRLLADGWPLIVAGLSVTVYMKIDRIMLGEMLGERAVGTYSTAATLSEVWNFFPVAVASSLFPIVVRSRERADAALYERRMQALYDAMAVGAYVVAAATTLLAPWAVKLLFRPEFAESARILQVHIWSLLFVALGVVRSRYLIAENLVRFSMMATLAGGALNVVLNWLWIPRHGGLGAAWATVVSYGVAAWLSGWAAAPVRATTRRMTRALVAPLRPRSVWAGLREILR